MIPVPRQLDIRRRSKNSEAWNYYMKSECSWYIFGEISGRRGVKKIIRCDEIAIKETMYRLRINFSSRLQEYTDSVILL